MNKLDYSSNMAGSNEPGLDLGGVQGVRTPPSAIWLLLFRGFEPPFCNLATTIQVVRTPSLAIWPLLFIMTLSAVLCSFVVKKSTQKLIALRIDTLDTTGVA